MAGRIIVVLVLVTVLGGAALAWWLGALGVSAEEQESRAEAWARRQVLKIAGDLLRPELEFDRFEYRFPGDLTVEGVRLIDGDEIVVAASTIRIVLAEVPRPGRPIVIESIELASPTLRLVQGADGRLAGFSDLLASTDGAVADDGASSRPSDVFAIRRLGFADAALVYERPGEPAMRLDELHFELLGTPAGAPGWYGLELALDRMPLFALDAQGRLNVDDVVLELDDTTMTVDLEAEGRQVLPPQVQAFLADLQAGGHLELGVSGRLPLTDPLALDATCGLLLSRARVASAVRGLAVELTELDVNVAVAEGVATIERFAARLLGGTIEASGSVPLDPTASSTLELSVRDLDLARAVADPELGGLGGLRTGIATADLRFEGVLGGLNGLGPLADRTIELDVDLRDAALDVGPLDTVIDDARWVGGTADGGFRFAPFDLKIAGGEARLDGTAWPPRRRARGADATAVEAVAGGDGGGGAATPVDESGPPPTEPTPSAAPWAVRSDIAVTGVDLARVFRAPEDGGKGLGGVLDVAGDVAGPVAPPGTSLAGSGSMRLVGLDVARVPVITALVHEVVGRLGGRRTGTLESAWSLDGPTIVLSDTTLEAPVIAARGSGRVGFDGRLDLSVNAGPLEKLQGQLGGVGRIFGRITDALVTYRITGTTGDPKVRVKPLGGM